MLRSYVNRGEDELNELKLELSVLQAMVTLIRSFPEDLQPQRRTLDALWRVITEMTTRLLDRYTYPMPPGPDGKRNARIGFHE